MKNIIGIWIIVSAGALAALSAACSEPDGPDDPPPVMTVAVDGVSLDTPELSITVGGDANLTARVSPINATNKQVSWSTSYASVARIDANGKLSALRVGTATIVATTVDGQKTAECTVQVTPAAVAATGVSLRETYATVNAESRLTLVATVIPTNASDRSLKWESSDTSVATVEEGVVTGIKVGSTTVTCTTVDGGHRATCSVTVIAADPDNLLQSSYIPDPVFLAYCRKQTAWDSNNDGKLYRDEAAQVLSIDVANITGNAITSLTGIEYFTAITYLDCSANNLVSLDVSSNSRLTELYCNNNSRLSSLTMSYSMLRILNCSACSLTSLNVSRCTRLVDLSCYHNDLSQLDLSACVDLTFLDIDGNGFTALDLSKNRALRGLICSDNDLVSLDLSPCTALTTLECNDNELTSLDLSKNGALISVNCNRNQLASLDISHCAILETLSCHSNGLASITVGADNTRLRYVFCPDNLLEAAALNELFVALPPSGAIVIYNNPGARTCDASIAVTKNWTVQVE